MYDNVKQNRVHGPYGDPQVAPRGLSKLNDRIIENARIQQGPLLKKGKDQQNQNVFINKMSWQGLFLVLFG